MVKINTDLGVNVQLDSVKKVQAPQARREQGDPTKSNLERLAGVFASVNPTLARLANKNLQQQAEQDMQSGQMTVNNMTLEEARKAHDEGFPDLFNGWAKYGARVQYAENATDFFFEKFKDEYKNNRHDPNYNWKESFRKQSDEFLADKQGSPEFNTVYNKAYSQLNKYLNVQEFERKSDELKDTAELNTVYKLENIGKKVEEDLEIEFFQSRSPSDLNTDNYAPKKDEYIRINFEKKFQEKFQEIKNTRNASLSKVDFDKLLIHAAERHASQGGIQAGAYIALLQNPRPDGTPPIVSNPNLRKAAEAAIKNLKESNAGNLFALEYNMGRTVNYDDGDFKKLANQAFVNAVNHNKQNGMNDRQAHAAALTKDLGTGVAVGRPIPKVKEIFQRPIGIAPTNDNMIALDMYLELDKRGLVGRYFTENNTNAIKWAMMAEEVKNGKDPREVLTRIGTWESRTVKSFLQLNSTEKGNLASDLGVRSQKNIALVQNLGTYFKNLTGVDGNWEDLTKKYIEKHYETLPNGTGLVNKNTLAELQVDVNEWDEVKTTAIKLLGQKYEGIPNLIAPVVSQRLAIPDYIEEDIQVKEDYQYNMSGYDLTLDPEKGVVYFIPRGEDDFVSGDVPLVVTDKKTGRSAFAQLPISAITAVHHENRLKRQAEEDKIALERRRKAEARKTIDDSLTIAAP